jgi:hypothetical protein
LNEDAVNRDEANKILEILDGFSDPINALAEQLRSLSDEKTKKECLAALGEVMGLLESNIGYKARKVLRE